MSQSIIELKDGARIELTAKGFKVISSTGKILYFDEYGNLVTKFDYFFKMGKNEREVVGKWVKEVKAETEKQESFLEKVKAALNIVDYDYKISTIEPSIGENGVIYFEKGNPVAVGISELMWREYAKKFDEKCNSRLATLSELLLWYAYRIAIRAWDFSYLADNSSSAGNYWNSPEASQEFELSGVREVGGFSDGIGNTDKLVSLETGGFALVGGFYYNFGFEKPVANIKVCDASRACITHGSGVIVLLN